MGWMNSRIAYKSQMKTEGEVKKRYSLQHRNGGQEYINAGSSI